MKKIIAIIGGCLVAIILVATVILACTRYTAYTLDIAKPYFIEVYRGDSDPITHLEKDSEEYNKIISLYTKSFKENNLSTLFQGAKSFKKQVKNQQVSVDSILNNTNGNYILLFSYASSTQTLKIDGKDYVNPDNENEKITYNYLYLEVANTANYTEFTVYLVGYGETESYWQVKLIAHQNDLYSYVNDLAK